MRLITLRLFSQIIVCFMCSLLFLWIFFSSNLFIIFFFSFVFKVLAKSIYFNAVKGKANNLGQFCFWKIKLVPVRWHMILRCGRSNSRKRSMKINIRSTSKKYYDIKKIENGDWENRVVKEKRTHVYLWSRSSFSLVFLFFNFYMVVLFFDQHTFL